jgi:hypothetical protein
MDDLTNGAAPVAAETTPVAESAPVTTTTTEPVVTEAPSIRDTMAEVLAKHNPPRAQGGQFAPKNPAEAPAAAVEPAAENTDQPEAVAPEPAQPAIEAPQSWSAEMKAKFGTLPPDLREFIAKRESESHKAITQYGQQVKAFEPIRTSLDRHMDIIRANGVTPDQAIENMFSVAKALETDPHGAIRQIAEMHGVDLRSFADGAEPQAQKAPEVAALEQELAKIKGFLTAQQRQQIEQDKTAAASEIAKFSEGKPYFEEARPMMAKLMESGAAESLQDAYDQAIWAIPTIRERIQQDQRKADEEKRSAEAKKRADDAKRVAPLNQRSSQGASPAVSGSMRDTLAAVAAKHFS